MIKILTFVALIFIPSIDVAIASSSQWYWVSVPNEPMTGYFIEEVSPNTVGYEGAGSGSHSGKTVTPDGFMDVMNETKDSSKCSGELNSAISQLRNFDSREVIQPDVKCMQECGPYFSEESLPERESLLSQLKTSAEQCLLKEQTAIKKAEEERIQKEAEAKRLDDIAEAIESCDYDYFNNEMTNDERMRTYNERMKCQDSTTLPAPAYVVPPVIKETYIPPQQVIPTVTRPVPEVVTDNFTDVNDEETTSLPASFVEGEQMTEEASESDTGQQLTEESSVAEPESVKEPQKESFFKKVWNFLFGWW